MHLSHIQECTVFSILFRTTERKLHDSVIAMGVPTLEGDDEHVVRRLLEMNDIQTGPCAVVTLQPKNEDKRSSDIQQRIKASQKEEHLHCSLYRPLVP